MLHDFVAYFPLSIFINGHVLCDYICQANAVVTNIFVAMLNLRNDHGALLILGVEGHW